MILRTSGIGVSIVFLREAQWGSRGREFDSRHSDHLLLSRTVFGLVRLGSFFCFSTIFFGNVEIDGQFRVAHLDLAHQRMRGVQLGEHEGNVIVAAVVGHKHAGPPGGDVLPPGDGDGHARHGQQAAGPVGHILGGQGIAHGVVAPLLGGKALVQHGPGIEQVAPEIDEPDNGAHGGTPSVTGCFS